MLSNDPRSNRLYWEGIIALLTEAASKLQDLERVKLVICLRGERKLLAKQLDDVQWEQLEEVLCQISQLQSVEVMVEHRGQNTEADEMAWKIVTANLPTMASRGILRRV